jgi:hypothetical protein
MPDRLRRSRQNRLRSYLPVPSRDGRSIPFVDGAPLAMTGLFVSVDRVRIIVEEARPERQKKSRREGGQEDGFSCKRDEFIFNSEAGNVKRLNPKNSLPIRTNICLIWSYVISPGYPHFMK